MLTSRRDDVTSLSAADFSRGTTLIVGDDADDDDDDEDGAAGQVRLKVKVMLPAAL